MTAPLVLGPVFQPRPWGGRQLATRFGYDLPEGRVGECWGVSAHPHGPARVVGGPHDGRTLEEVWESDRAFFGGGSAEGGFPLLVKLLDADDWLSVQVHPDDAAAERLEGVPWGKSECWYVVAAQEGAELVLGHRARTYDELVGLVDAGRWDDLLVRRSVRAGDFVHVPSGTLHAIGPGLLVYELQQSCDTTYRVWDFDRRDAEGQLRELHLDKAKAVLTAPHDPSTTETEQAPVEVPGGRRRALIDGPSFCAVLHEVTGPGYTAPMPGWCAWTVLEGSGTARWEGEEHALAAGDHLLLPADAGEVRLDGELLLIAARPAG